MKVIFLIVLYQLLICCVLGNNSTSHEQQGNSTVGEFVRKQIDAIDEATKGVTIKDLITIHEPPTSIICNKTNSDSIKIVKNAEGQLYLLSVNELLAIEVDEEREPRLDFLGTLLQFEEKPLDVQIENWQNMTIIVLKLPTSLHVYVTKNDQRGVRLEPLQKISIHSSADRYILFKNKDDIFLVTYWIKEDVLDANELTFYKWKASFFSKESQEQVDLPSKSELFIFNENVNEPLILSIGYGNSTRVVILKLNLQTNRWTKLQSLYFKQDYVRHYVIKGRLYLIGCSSDSYCAIYEWKQPLFRRQIKVNNQIFEKIKRIYYQHGMIITEDHQRNLSLFTTDDIISAPPVLLFTYPSDVASYAIYKSPANQKLFYVEFSLKPSILAINFYDVSINKAHETTEKSESKHGNGVECIANLKSYLKSRIPTVQSSQVLVQKMTNHDHTLQMDNKKFFRAMYSNVKDSKIHRVKMPNVVKVSASKMQKQAIDVNVLVEQTRRLLKRSKQPQMQGRADGEIVEPMDSIVVENLIHKGNDPIFQDLLLRSEPVLTFTDEIKLRNLTANKLVVIPNQINQIVLNDLLNSTRVSTVIGSKRIQQLNVKELITLQTVNNVPKVLLEAPAPDKSFEITDEFEFLGEINVKSLNVKSLNGFDVSAIVNNVFLQNERTVLRGNLIIRGLANVNQLIVGQLMDVPVDNFMTTSTDQTIEANVKINMFHADKLTTNLINNEKLNENVARMDSVNIIKVPTQFMTIHVLKNLNIQNDGADEADQRNRVAETIETLKEHVIGKQSSDLEQIYNGRVIIQGSLVVRDIETFSPKTRIFLGSLEAPQNISSNFWMKNVQQDIFVEQFTIANQQVKGGSVFTNILNGHPVKKFLMLDANPSGIVRLRFEKAVVEGDVKGHKDNFPSLLFHLNQTVVRRQGPPALIDGSIDFRGMLVTRDLETNFINEIPLKDLIHKNQEHVVVLAQKNVKELELNHLLVDGSFSVDNFNNVNIKQFLNDAVRIDRPIEFDSLKITKFDAVNLITEFFEGHQFNEFIESLDKQFQLNVDGSSRAKRNVKIFGNVNFQSEVFVDTINGTTRFDDFMNMFVLMNEATSGIGGKKTFKQNVILTDFNAQRINSFPVNRLLYQSLARGEKQTISGEFFVKNLKTRSLRTKALNKIAWNQFVDKTKLHLPLKINLNVDELVTRHLDSGSSSYDLSKMMEIVQYPKRKKWNYITVSDRANIPLQQASYLDRIVQFAVYKNGPEQIITGQVQMNTNKIFFKNLLKVDGIVNAKMDLVNLHVLYSDSVKKESKVTQTIKGVKTFLAPIYVYDVRIGPKAYFEAIEINEVNIAELNRTIVRPTSIIRKEKKFLSLHVDDIEIRGKINGIPFDSLIFIINNDMELPKLTINQLEVQNLNTYTFNDYSVSRFLNNRMRKFLGPEQEVTGLLTFSSLNLFNDSNVSSINGVAIDDIVFSRSDQLQDIIGHKSVVGNITLIGPSVIRNINEYDFTDFIKNSIVRNQNHVKETMELSSIELRKGLTARHSINGRRFDELLTCDAHVPKLSDLVSLMEQVENQIKELNTAEKAKNVKPKRVLYIDYVPDINISYDGARESNDRCTDKIIESAGHNNVIVREKRDTVMVVEVPSSTLTIKPNLHCREGDITSKELSLWWTYKDGGNQTFFRNFRFTNEISDVKFVEARSGDILMILTMLSVESPTSEIAILWLNKKDHDWYERQPKFVNLNRITKSALVKTSVHQFLVVSSYNGTTTPDSDYVMILRLDIEMNVFVENQQRLPGDKFDIILSVDVSSKRNETKARTFLLLTRKGSKKLFIYHIKEDSQEFSFQRKIPFENEIVEVVVLYINNGPPFFIVSLQTGDFCIFEWHGIESWKVMQCGHFSFINQIKSYEYLKRQHLFLTSTLNSGTALAVHRQGEQLF